MMMGPPFHGAPMPQQPPPMQPQQIIVGVQPHYHSMPSSFGPPQFGSMPGAPMGFGPPPPGMPPPAHPQQHQQHPPPVQPFPPAPGQPFPPASGQHVFVVQNQPHQQVQQVPHPPQPGPQGNPAFAPPSFGPPPPPHQSQVFVVNQQSHPQHYSAHQPSLSQQPPPNIQAQQASFDAMRPPAQAPMPVKGDEEKVHDHSPQIAPSFSLPAIDTVPEDDVLPDAEKPADDPESPPADKQAKEKDRSKSSRRPKAPHPSAWALAVSSTTTRNSATVPNQEQTSSVPALHVHPNNAMMQPNAHAVALGSLHSSPQQTQQTSRPSQSPLQSAFRHSPPSGQSSAQGIAKDSQRKHVHFIEEQARKLPASPEQQALNGPPSVQRSPPTHGIVVQQQPQQQHQPSASQDESLNGAHPEKLHMGGTQTSGLQAGVPQQPGLVQSGVIRQQEQQQQQQLQQGAVAQQQASAVQKPQIVRPLVLQASPPSTGAALSSPRPIGSPPSGLVPAIATRSTAFTPVTRSSPRQHAGTARMLVATRGVSPHAQCVCMALAAKGVPFDVIEVPPATSADCPQWFKEASPSGGVPVLATTGPNSAPAAVNGTAADVDSTLAFIDSLPSSIRLVPPGAEQAVNDGVSLSKQILVAFEQIMLDGRPAAQKEGIAKLNVALDGLEASLVSASQKSGGRKGPYFLGDGTAVSLADVWLAPTAARLSLLAYFRATGVDAQRTPLTAAYFAAASSWPEHALSAPPLERMRVSYKSELGGQSLVTPTDVHIAAARTVMQRLVDKSAACADAPCLRNLLQLTDMWSSYRTLFEAQLAMHEHLGILLSKKKEAVASLEYIENLVKTAFLSNGPARHTASHACAQAFVQAQVDHDTIFRDIERDLLPILRNMTPEQYTPLFANALAIWRGGTIYLVLPTILDAVTAWQAEQYMQLVLQAVDDGEWRSEGLTAVKDAVVRGALSHERFQSLCESLPQLAD